MVPRITSTFQGFSDIPIKTFEAACGYRPIKTIDFSITV